MNQHSQLHDEAARKARREMWFYLRFWLYHRLKPIRFFRQMRMPRRKQSYR